MVETIPLYWMHETSGKMQALIRKFLNGIQLSENELEIMRWYIFQWVDAMPIKPKDFSKSLLDSMTQEHLNEYICKVLLPLGIDPL